MRAAADPTRPDRRIFGRGVSHVRGMSRHQNPKTRVACWALATLPIAGLSACGDDGEPDTLAVTMADFHYGDLPETVEAGTTIEVGNTSEGELHEFVAFRLDDGDERPADEIMSGDVESLLGSKDPTMVLLAPPDSDEQIVAVGEPEFAEAGRYLILCAIPTGADPDEYLTAAATSEGPPQVDGGPPHFVHGMYAVIDVEA